MRHQRLVRLPIASTRHRSSVICLAPSTSTRSGVTLAGYALPVGANTGSLRQDGTGDGHGQL
jgi:hypothetical protein